MGLSKREVLVWSHPRSFMILGGFIYLGLWHTIALNLSLVGTTEGNIIRPIGMTDILGQDFSPAEHIYTPIRVVIDGG
jgi:hypothetical protein